MAVAYGSVVMVPTSEYKTSKEPNFKRLNQLLPKLKKRTVHSSSPQIFIIITFLPANQTRIENPIWFKL